MKKGQDFSAKFSNIFVVHQNLPNKKHSELCFSDQILFIPLQGEIKITLSENQIKLGVGQMLYLPAETTHSFVSSDQLGERLIVLIQKKSRGSFISLKPVKLPLNQLVKELLFYLLLNPKTKNSDAIVDIFIQTLTELVSAASTHSMFMIEHAEAHIKDSRIRASLEFMKENLELNLSMDKIAQTAGLSTRNLNRVFLKETGLQPKQWLINYRIEKAKELLKSSNASITDVALSVGYNSLSQFISAFRSKTGQLPSDYSRHG